MWVMSKWGFYSIVENFNIAGHFLVRARVKADLVELLAEAGVKRRPQFKSGTDYEFRVTVSEGELVKIFGALERSITYSNFKAACDQIPRLQNRRGLLGEVWWLLKENLARLGRIGAGAS